MKEDKLGKLKPLSRIGEQMSSDGVKLRIDLFSLKEGNLAIQWPDPLSQESFEDLEAYFQISLRKIKRSVEAKERRK